MTTTTLADVLDGLDQTITGVLAGVGFYRIASGPVGTPAVIVASITASAETDTEGARDFTVELAVVTESRNDDDVSDLLAMLEPTNSLSVPAALEGDTTLGGRVADLTVGEIGSLREILTGGTLYWGGSVEVEITGLGDPED